MNAIAGLLFQHSLQTNIVAVLREQARLSFYFDKASGGEGQYRVHEKLAPSRQKPYTHITEAMDDLTDQANTQPEKFPHLRHNFLYRQWQELRAAKSNALPLIDNALAAAGYSHFHFLDHGGRATVFRAQHVPTQRHCVVRMESHHFMRFDRPHHATILPSILIHDEKGGISDFADIKVEICPEIIPISKIPLRRECEQEPHLSKAFHEVAYRLSWGSNATYPDTMYDHDADITNMGLLPSGHIVSADPLILHGARAQELHHHRKTPEFLRDASPLQLRLLYGQPDVR